MSKNNLGQFEYIVAQTAQGVAGQFLSALLVSYLLLKTGFPEQPLYIWDVCAATLLAHRYLSFRGLARNRDFSDIPQIVRVTRRYTANAFLTGVLWAALFAKIIQQSPLELHYVSIALGMGLAAAAIITLGAMFRIYFAFSAPILFTLIVAFYLRDSHMHTVSAIILLVGSSYLLYTAYKYSHHFQVIMEKTERIRDTELEALICLGRAGEYRDADTGDHILRVGYASYLLARTVGFSEQDATDLMYAAPLHDLGKIGIPDHILLKPEKLTEEESHAMKRHTLIGAEILGSSQSSVMKVAKIVALNHHEKWDGSGYPNGISGENIPIEGRIVAICDVFDALTSGRPYKKRWTDMEAMDFLRKNSGTHFDPRLVEPFIQNIPRVKEYCYHLEDHESATGLHPIIQQPA